MCPIWQRKIRSPFVIHTFFHFFWHVTICIYWILVLSTPISLPVVSRFWRSNRTHDFPIYKISVCWNIGTVEQQTNKTTKKKSTKFSMKNENPHFQIKDNKRKNTTHTLHFKRKWKFYQTFYDIYSMYRQKFIAYVLKHYNIRYIL